MSQAREDILSQQGRKAVVTGSGGLGFEVALALAMAGADVIIAARNPQKGEDAVRRINAAAAGAKAEFIKLDLASLESIAQFAAQLAERYARVDLLINNAGIMSPPQRQATADGFEVQFGVNHLGHFALTGRLLPLLRSSAAPRVVSVTSLAHRYAQLTFDDLQSERAYNPGLSYCQSKLAQLLFAFELQRRSDEAGWGITSNAAHPGYAATSLFENGPGAKSMVAVASSLVILPLLGHSAAAGARPILYAATSAGAKGGSLYGPSGVMEMKGPTGLSKVAPAARDIEAAARLWRVSEQLTTVSFAADG